MSYVEDLRDIIMEDIIQARKHKDRIEELDWKEALDEIEKLTPMQMKTILQLYVVGVTT